MSIESLPSLVPAYALMEQAEFHQQRGDIDVARTLWVRIRTDYGTTCFRLRYVDFLCSIGELIDATQELKELFDLATESTDSSLKTVVAHNLAAVWRMRGETHVAASWQQVAIGQSDFSSPADLSGRAEDAFLAGEFELAEVLVRQSLTWEIRRGDREGQAADWGLLGLIRAGQDDFQDAKRCLGRAFALHRKTGDGSGMATDLLNLGELFAAKSEWWVAHRLFERSRFVAEQAGNSLLTHRASQNARQAQKILDVADRSPQWN